jgi:hypothetical protein
MHAQGNGLNDGENDGDDRQGDEGPSDHAPPDWLPAINSAPKIARILRIMVVIVTRPDEAPVATL